MFGLFKTSREKQQDAIMDAQEAELERRVEAALSSDDQQRLFERLVELREATFRQAAITGMSEKQAFRMYRGAALQTMAAFLEIERMLTPKGKAI